MGRGKDTGGQGHAPGGGGEAGSMRRGQVSRQRGEHQRNSIYVHSQA